MWCALVYLFADEGPKLVKVDHRAVVLVLVQMEVPHTNLASKCKHSHQTCLQLRDGWEMLHLTSTVQQARRSNLCALMSLLSPCYSCLSVSYFIGKRLHSVSQCIHLKKSDQAFAVVHLAKVARMPLVEQDAVMMLTTSITTARRVLPVLANAAVTAGHVAPLFAVLLQVWVPTQTDVSTMATWAGVGGAHQALHACVMGLCKRDARFPIGSPPPPPPHMRGKSPVPLLPPSLPLSLLIPLPSIGPRPLSATTRSTTVHSRCEYVPEAVPDPSHRFRDEGRIEPIRCPAVSPNRVTTTHC